MQKRTPRSPAAGSPRQQGNLTFGSFRFDPANRILSSNGAEVALAPKALSVLECLLERRGEVVSKQDLLDQVWSDAVVEESTLVQVIKTLRKALDDDPRQPTYIQTIHRRGYRFIAPVSVDGEASGLEREGDVGNAPVAGTIVARRIGRRLRFLDRREHRVVWSLIALLAVVGSLVGVAYWKLTEFSGREGVREVAASALPFQERAWVLIADFANTTGEPIFDGILERALGRELSNSDFVNVVPRQRIQDTLRLMRKPPNATVNAAVGREICLRDAEIHAVLTGRMEKLGSTYALTVELVDPGEGVTVASLSEEALGQDDVLPATRRLSSRARENLVEQLSEFSVIPAHERLAKVTTSSLRALQLFTAYGDHDRRTLGLTPGIELLQQAIAEDPEFATAYIHIAYQINNSDGPPEERRWYAERALELADAVAVTESERYFIRASYFRLTGQFDEAVANYKALLRIDPEHYRVNHNLAAVLGWYTPRYEEAVPYFVQAAQQNPDSPAANFNAARALAIWANRPAEARPYVQRALELATEDSPAYVFAWLSFYPVHERWLKGDLQGVLEEIDRWAETMTSPTNGDQNRGRWNAVAPSVGSFYLALGKLEAAEAMFDRIQGSDWRNSHLLRVTIARNGEENLGKEVVIPPTGNVRSQGYSLGDGALAVSYLARSGRLPEARELVAELESRWAAASIDDRYPSEPYVAIARAELALAEGRGEEMIRPLQKALYTLQPTGGVAFFRGAETLARIHEAKGNVDQARKDLEFASQEKNRSYGAGSRVGPQVLFFHSEWMRVQWKLAQIYRKLGRLQQARAIEAELRDLLVYADPDMWLVRQLRALEESDAGSSHQ